MSELIARRCAACAAGTPPLSVSARDELGSHVPNWSVIDDGKKIRREYRFKTYMDGANWVPLIGAIADGEDHHPDIVVLYRKVIVDLWTHTVNGLSENDYILAAKFDAQYGGYAGRR